MDLDFWDCLEGKYLQLITEEIRYWVYKTREEMIRCEMRIACEETKVDLYNLCREVCSEVLFKEDAKVGGPGKIVGINESKFGERKYHKGKKKDRVWVSGGIERDTKDCFLVSVEDRSVATLIPIIKTHDIVLPGTIMISGPKVIKNFHAQLS